MVCSVEVFELSKPKCCFNPTPPPTNNTHTKKKENLFWRLNAMDHGVELPIFLLLTNSVSFFNAKLYDVVMFNTIEVRLTKEFRFGSILQ